MNARSKSTLPFSAEHIGSLVRPTSLVLARNEFEAGRIDHKALRSAEDEAIRQAVALQERVGLQVVTDGEFRRGTYSDSFTTQGIRGVLVELTEHHLGNPSKVGIPSGMW